MGSCASPTAPARSCSWITPGTRRLSWTARAGSCCLSTGVRRGARGVELHPRVRGDHLDADAARRVRLPRAHVAVSRRRARVRGPGQSPLGGEPGASPRESGGRPQPHLRRPPLARGQALPSTTASSSSRRGCAAPATRPRPRPAPGLLPAGAGSEWGNRGSPSSSSSAGFSPHCATAPSSPSPSSTAPSPGCLGGSTRAPSTSSPARGAAPSSPSTVRRCARSPPSPTSSPSGRRSVCTSIPTSSSTATTPPSPTPWPDASSSPGTPPTPSSSSTVASASPPTGAPTSLGAIPPSPSTCPSPTGASPNNGPPSASRAGPNPSGQPPPDTGTRGQAPRSSPTSSTPGHSYRACLGILRLAKTDSHPRLEAAAQRALTLGTRSVRSIESIPRFRHSEPAPAGSKPGGRPQAPPRRAGAQRPPRTPPARRPRQPPRTVLLPLNHHRRPLQC